MATQLNDPSITFKAWGWSENCTLLLDQLVNRTISEAFFLEACKPHADIDAGTVVLAILLTLLLLGTAGGNILVIIAILIVKKLRSPTNLLIVNLAVTDFLVSILVLPFAIAYQILGYWPFNQIICNLYNISDVLLCTLSILSLCTISIDRYLAITKPLQYAAKRTPKRMLLMICISWLLSAAISIPPVFGWEQKNSPFYCGYSEELTYQIYATMTAFYIPLTVMVILYGKILVLAKQMALTNAQVARESSTEMQARTSSIPAYADWNRNSLYPTRESYTSQKVYTEANDNWQQILEPNNTDFKSRQSVVSFKSPPAIRPPGRCQDVRGKFCCLFASSHRASTEITNNGKSLEQTASLSGPTRPPLSLLRRKRRRSPSDQGKGETHKAVTTLGVIMGCFTVCWLPFFVSQLITPIINCFTKQKFSIPPTLFQVFVWLGYCNSFLNPLIYALFNREFRLPFIYILRFQCYSINTRLRTETFSHQFDLPRKSGLSYRNSLARGSSSSCNRRQQRRKLRGLSPLANVSPHATINAAGHTKAPSSEHNVFVSHLSSEHDEVLQTPHSLFDQPSRFSIPTSLFTASEVLANPSGNDLLENTLRICPLPNCSQESDVGIRSDRIYDTHIPYLNVQFQRRPRSSPSSAPPNLTTFENSLHTWTGVSDYQPKSQTCERRRRQSDAAVSPLMRNKFQKKPRLIEWE
uniref:Serotonin receptor 5-HT7 n=1 Tax=Mesocestoides corti TaxID=53468 RepID=A0A482LRJ4_MESCO|nr:serotonin receptor 5-HT7 [Mesocestoides corti]